MWMTLLKLGGYFNNSLDLIWDPNECAVMKMMKFQMEENARSLDFPCSNDLLVGFKDNSCVFFTSDFCDGS